MSKRVRCSVCGFVFKGRIPKGGDGSELVPYPHKRWPDRVSDAFRVPMVDCEGRLHEGVPVDENIK